MAAAQSANQRLDEMTPKVKYLEWRLRRHARHHHHRRHDAEAAAKSAAAPTK